MKRGFTLVEMLVVVVVLVTLMSITFRLSSIGDQSQRRNVTIARLQRIENCLSGYYAAFGSYPPVKLHGSQDYNQQVNGYGIAVEGSERQLSLNWYTETGNHGIGSTAEQQDWRQVEAACRAQPFAARFPYPEGYNEVIKARLEVERGKIQENPSVYSEAYRNQVNAGWDDGYTDNPGRFASYLNSKEWSEIQLFQFGLMSYLLPRYLIMLKIGQNARDLMDKCMQWNGNNILPSNPMGTGEKFSSWSALSQEVSKGCEGTGKNEYLAKIASISSQAVCARWMPNLEKSCYSFHTFQKECFGINIQETSQHLEGSTMSVFSPGSGSSGGAGGNGAGSDQYVLDLVTMTDGWNHELYYYSPAPYQSYTVWSAGENGRTFPPWASREDFNGTKNKCIGAWIADDIMQMSN